MTSEDMGAARLREALEEIARHPTTERNPDGEDQAAWTMQLIAREALAAVPEAPELALTLFGYEVQLTISVGRCRVDASPAIKVTDMGKVELDMGVVSDLIATAVKPEAAKYPASPAAPGEWERVGWERVEEGTER